MNSLGYHGQQYCLWVRMHDDDNGVVQDGGHSVANRETEKYSLGLQRPLTLDINVMVN